jgi:hypothetical protein
MTNPPGDAGDAGDAGGNRHDWHRDRNSPPHHRTTRHATLLAELRRRHAAAQRITGGDPLSAAEAALGRSVEHDRTAERPEVTEIQVAAAIITARDLLGKGYPPIFDRETLTAVWRVDKELAVLCHLLQTAEAP